MTAPNASEVEHRSRADEIETRLTALEDPKIRAVNERHGDDHGVNLTKLRAVAKEAGRDPDLARELWSRGGTVTRLVALLMFRPKSFNTDEIDAMLREARVPKVRAWLINYIAKKSPHALTLRERWISDADPEMASAGWALTSERIAQHAQTILDGDDPSGIIPRTLLDVIESEMSDASESLQWAMNECLATIGIHCPDLRPRALDIGERLGVLRDYPTSPGCTSPFAPTWITEMVRRRSET